MWIAEKAKFLYSLFKCSAFARLLLNEEFYQILTNAFVYSITLKLALYVF